MKDPKSEIHFNVDNSGQNKDESKSQENPKISGLNLSSPPPTGESMLVPQILGPNSSNTQKESKLLSTSLVSDLSFQINPFDRKRELELDIYSEISDPNRLTPKNLDELAMRAAGLLREAGGLIGSPNTIRQFCGSVLMVLALAIATTVAAVAVMSMLGVATPAFLVPYLAAIQASSMVSTVLNFVAAKLTLDLNTAAAVTAMATAGTLGLFGKAVNDSGAPTQLNCKFYSVAQDLENAWGETGAAISRNKY